MSDSEEEPKVLRLGEPLKDKPDPTAGQAVAVSQKKGKKSRWHEEGLDRVGITIVSETEKAQL